MSVLLFGVVGASILSSVGATDQFCATFSAPQTNHASGYFALSLDKSVATYTLHLNFTKFISPSTCDLSKGLKYHLDVNWANSANSASGSLCSSSGGYYDPALTCGPATYDPSGQCALLGRSLSSYSCSPSTFASGNYEACAVGDLSGKSGIIYPTSTGSKTFVVNVAKKDFSPPYLNAYDAKNPNPYLSKWSSVVFDCVSSGAPLLCAKLTKDTTGCLYPYESDPNYPVDQSLPYDPYAYTKDEQNEVWNNNNTAIALIVIGVGAIAIIYIFLWMKYKREKEEEVKLAAKREEAEAAAAAAAGLEKPVADAHSHA